MRKLKRVRQNYATTVKVKYLLLNNPLGYLLYQYSLGA